MGPCCTKFGSYLLRKEESKVSNGGTPKLNKLEHKQSFVVAPANTNNEKTADLSPQHHEDKLQPNKEDTDTQSKESDSEGNPVVRIVPKEPVAKSRSSSPSSSSDTESLNNADTNSRNDQILCQKSLGETISDFALSKAVDVEVSKPVTETPTPEATATVDKSSSEDESHQQETEINISQPEVSDPIIGVQAESENLREKAGSISSKKSSSSSSSESETEETATDDVQKSVATALLNAETKSNSSKISLESEKDEPPNNDTESNLPQITIESPVPDVKSSESEADVEKSPSIEHSESEQNKSSSSSSSSQSESENEAEDKYESANRSPTSKPMSPDNKSPVPDVKSSESGNEAEDKYESANRSPTSKPVSPDNKSADEPVVKSLDTENLTNGDIKACKALGDTCETTANFETGIDNSSGSEKVLSAEEASSDEANEVETEETEIEKVSKVEVQSYAQLITPAGYGGGNDDGYSGGDDGGYNGGGGYDGGYSGGGAGDGGGDCGGE